MREMERIKAVEDCKTNTKLLEILIKAYYDKIEFEIKLKKAASQ